MEMEEDMEMEQMNPLQVCVKAAIDDPLALGDCQASQTVLLILEEKEIPYDVDFINANDIPEWFLRISPEGKLPAVQIDGVWYLDADAIAEKLEDRFKIPSLANTIDLSSLTDPRDGTEVAMVSEFYKFEEHLRRYGPFVEGDDITLYDLKLAPLLYQINILLKKVKKWNAPGYLPHGENYYEMLYSRLSFIKTRASEESIIAAWTENGSGKSSDSVL
ncbi:Glutathione S-transferase dhar1, mitochondrial [Asimina triloba]